MAYDFNGGLSTLALKKPVKPSKVQAPDAKNLFLHYGENAAQYQSFIEAVSDLAQAFKFLPKYDQMKYEYGSPTASTDLDLLLEYDAALKEGGWADDAEFMAETFSKQMDPKYNTLIWGQGVGMAYSNLDFSPDASEWNLLAGVDSDDSSILDYHSSCLLQPVSSVNTYDLGNVHIIANSDKVYVNGALKTRGTDYTIDHKTGQITFSAGVIAGASEIKVDFDYNYFNWDAIKAIGGDKSYYEIAKGGAIGTDAYSPEKAFDLMYSMLESRERVFSVLHDIFGDSINLTTDNNAVITNISEWLGHYTEVDPHNLGILKMFFGMQTDFINTLDAYINCETYWGSDLPNTQVDFSDKLKEKVDAYILTLSGDPNTAAEALAAKALEDMWFAAPPRYDKVGDILTGELTPAKKVANCQLAVNAALAAYNGCAQTVCEKAQAAYDSALAAYNAVAENADPMSDAAIAALTARDAAQNALDTAKANLAIVNQTDENAGKTEQAALLASLQDAQNALKDAKAIYADFETNTSKSWVEFFCDRMDEYSSAEVIRVIVGYMMNRSADKKYRNEKTEYQDKKEDVIMDEISSQRMQAKAIAESKKNVKKIVSRNAKVSVAIKGRARASAVSGRRPSAIRSASRPAVRSAAGPAVRGAARTFVRHAAARTTPAHLAAGGAAKRVPSRIAGGQGIKRPAAAVGARAVAPVRPKAASPAPKPQAQAPKHDVKKVI